MKARILRPPWHLLTAAVLLSAAFAFCHMVGYREHVSFLSGTLPAGGGGLAAMACGAVYLLSYLLAVFVVPVLLLWAALSTGLRAVAGVRRRNGRSPGL